MENTVEIRYAGVVVGRSAAVRDLDGSGAFIALGEPLPVGTLLSVKTGDAVRDARIEQVVESADAAATGMRVRFVAGASPGASPGSGATVIASSPPAPAEAPAAPPAGGQAEAVPEEASGPASGLAAGGSGPSDNGAPGTDDGGQGSSSRRRRRRR